MLNWTRGWCAANLYKWRMKLHRRTSGRVVSYGHVVAFVDSLLIAVHGGVAPFY